MNRVEGGCAGNVGVHQGATGCTGASERELPGAGEGACRVMAASRGRWQPSTRWQSRFARLRAAPGLELRCLRAVLHAVLRVVLGRCGRSPRSSTSRAPWCTRWGGRWTTARTAGASSTTWTRGARLGGAVARGGVLLCHVGMTCAPGRGALGAVAWPHDSPPPRERTRHRGRAPSAVREPSASWRAQHEWRGTAAHVGRSGHVLLLHAPRAGA